MIMLLKGQKDAREADNTEGGNQRWRGKYRKREIKSGLRLIGIDKEVEKS